MNKDLFLCKQLFRAHSKTYYYSSWLFPKEIRHNVYILYAFVRLADELVDNPTQDPTTALQEFTDAFHRAWEMKTSDQTIIRLFVELAHRYHFERIWVEAFLHSMAMDLTTTRYKTQEDLDRYIFGSAEVIGLMMSKLMDVGEEGLSYAQDLGWSMQMINFVRDIGEDRTRGRIYIPLLDLEKFQVQERTWEQDTFTPDEQEKINALLTYEIEKITIRQKQAEKGLDYIPGRSKFAVSLAAYTYFDTLLLIQKDPLSVFRKKHASTRRQIVHIFLHTLASFIFQK